MGAKQIVPVGTKFGKLTVISDAEPTIGSSGKPHRRLLCQCECGKQTTPRLDALKRGRVVSCGCWAQGQHTTHGLSRHPLHRIWTSMCERCNSQSHRRYKDYGGRDISVCDEWASSFQAFYDWATSNGWTKGLGIDRIENDLGYSPSNCRFTTCTINNRNKRNNRFLTAFGETKCLSEWAAIAGITPTALSFRLKRGWSIEDAVSIRRYERESC